MISKHRELFIFICMLLIVPLAGEPRIHPFGNEFSGFRVSFGSPMFLLFLLWLRNVPQGLPSASRSSCSAEPSMRLVERPSLQASTSTSRRFSTILRMPSASPA